MSSKPGHASISSHTDVKGSVVIETVYYPFGMPRYEDRPTGAKGADPNFAFTDKELDRESRLNHFGVRYYNTITHKLTGTDPMSVTARSRLLDSQKQNPYSFCQNT